jgi:flagellar hook-associated protein 1 FlgK
MSTMGGILSIARSALMARQTALQVASQNVANAETEGYTRQRVELASLTPLAMPYGSLGTGVRVQTISRARDALLDVMVRQDSGAAASLRTAADALGQVDAIFGEPSEHGLSATIDAFFSAWDDLSGEPTGVAARGVVLERGRQLVATLNDMAAQLDQLGARTRVGLVDDVAEVNSLLQQVAALNPRITADESTGHSANDLRDERDRLLDRLGELAGATVLEREGGTVAVYIGGRLMVDRNSAHTVVMSAGASPVFSVDGPGDPITSPGGRLAGGQRVIAVEIPRVMAQLDSLAKGLVDSVNAIHSTGVLFTPAATPAGNFFEATTPLPVGGDQYRTARGIRLASTLVSATDIAAAGAGAIGPGNNAVASAMSLLRQGAVAFTSPDGATTYATTTFGDFYRQTVADAALVTRSAIDGATTHEAVAANSEMRRQSVSGVAIDEELTNVIAQQQAYAAAARLVSVVEEMTETLITMTR